ncbi:hypothetical protein BJF78_28030 [Pseudonocardia sp. CNS-139]|nr:hypothetical protein BJF78_28030 [Pseudonocardia sp. CNS-139]
MRTSRRILLCCTALAAVAAGTASAAPAATPQAAQTTVRDAAPQPPVVVLDPGHNGRNGAHPDVIARPVPDGRGGTKPCNTTGTATDAGYPEHAFTFDVATRAAGLLTAAGVRVVLTRPDDNGVGPCVDERGAAGGVHGAAAVVAIHADGSAAGHSGFHVAYADPPLNQVQAGPALGLATALRDALRAAGFPDADYIGRDGLSPRSDLAGLNHATRPTALVECANMRNPAEAALVSSEAGAPATPRRSRRACWRSSAELGPAAPAASRVVLQNSGRSAQEARALQRAPRPAGAARDQRRSIALAPRWALSSSIAASSGSRSAAAAGGGPAAASAIIDSSSSGGASSSGGSGGSGTPSSAGAAGRRGAAAGRWTGRAGAGCGRAGVSPPGRRAGAAPGGGPSPLSQRTCQRTPSTVCSRRRDDVGVARLREPPRERRGPRCRARACRPARPGPWR